MKAEKLDNAADLYRADFHEWAVRTAELLRQGRLAEVDVEHVAEEISEMGNRDRREVRSRLEVLLMHLLKWQVQPEGRSSSWTSTIVGQQTQLRLIFEDSPSLRLLADEEFNLRYERARWRAISETGLPEEVFPGIAPYALEEALREGFFPE
ncbi:MAG TPA: DUF29 domain-containing protein [Bryobacteraceae bacterium]|nr:DUF29 domain-containing protein [Bryobacteraceae bacterium]